MKYKITIGKKIEIYTEYEALNMLKERVEIELELEKEYLEEEGLKTSERLSDLESIDIDWIYELEDRAELLFGYHSVSIIEYDYNIKDILEKNDYDYNKSQLSKSLYVTNNKEQLIRISNHDISKFGVSMHKVPDIDLVYKDEIINNEDINNYFNINVEGIIIL